MKPKIPGHWPHKNANDYWPLARIKPYEDNARTHPEEQIALLATLLDRWGPDQPIVVDENGEILKGHGRRLAASRAGLAIFWVVQRFGLTPAEKEALRIADNQVALLAGWDEKLLAPQVVALKTAGFDIAILGFPQAKLEAWIPPAPGPSVSPDATPEPPQKPVSTLGDLWLLGEHRVLCGDATDAAAWKRLFADGKTAAMTHTDPPYGVSYKAEGHEVIEGDDKRRDALFKMLVGSLRAMARHTADTGAFYVWHASTTREDFAQALKAAGLVERQYLIWAKPNFAFGHADYQWMHEPNFYCGKAGQAVKFYGDRTQSTVWHIAAAATPGTTFLTIANGVLLLDGSGSSLFLQAKAPKGKKIRQVRLLDGATVHIAASDRAEGTIWEFGRDRDYEHPTQKPVALAQRAIENSSRPGEIVIDGFLGSFTTGIACEVTGRQCRGTELDPAYCDVGIHRYARLVDSYDSIRLVTEDGTNIPFKEVQAMRENKADRRVSAHKKQTRPVRSKV